MYKLYNKLNNKDLTYILNINIIYNIRQLKEYYIQKNMCSQSKNDIYVNGMID